MELNKCIILDRAKVQGNDNSQTDVLYDAAEKDGYLSDNIIAIGYNDALGLSEGERKGLNALMEQIESDTSISCVYCYDPSRLGRNPETNRNMRNFLQEHRVQLVILNPPVKVFNDDFTITENANLMFNLMS